MRCVKLADRREFGDEVDIAFGFRVDVGPRYEPCRNTSTVRSDPLKANSSAPLTLACAAADLAGPGYTAQRLRIVAGMLNGPPRRKDSHKGSSVLEQVLCVGESCGTSRVSHAGGCEAAI